MGAVETLARLSRAGYKVRINDTGDKVSISPSQIPPDLLAMVRSYKTELLALLRAQTAKPMDYPLCPDSGARFMPWCAPIKPHQFRRWRAQVVKMVEELAALERWPRQDLDHVLTCVINGPVSDLRPNWHYFKGCLRKARTIKEKGGSTRK